MRATAGANAKSRASVPRSSTSSMDIDVIYGAPRRQDRSTTHPTNCSLHHLVEPLCKIGDGLGVDLTLVPLQQHVEIRAPRPPRLPALPAVAAQIVRGRRQHVGRALDQVTAAVAVIVDRELDVGGGHELGLADFA